MKENSIKKDIKILETFLDGTKCCKDCEIVCADCYIDYEEVQAIKHILSEYQMILKENEELKAKIDICDEIIENRYISKQEIKDKIEIELKKAEKDLQEAIRLEKEAKEKEGTILWWTAQIRLDERIKVLKEILKEVKKDGNGDNV